MFELAVTGSGSTPLGHEDTRGGELLHPIGGGVDHVDVARPVHRHPLRVTDRPTGCTPFRLEGRRVDGRPRRWRHHPNRGRPQGDEHHEADTPHNTRPQALRHRTPPEIALPASLPQTNARGRQTTAGNPVTGGSPQHHHVMPSRTVEFLSRREAGCTRQHREECTQAHQSSHHSFRLPPGSTMRGHYAPARQS